MEKYHHYEVASAAFQIGIVLASATVITGMMVLTYLAAGLGLDRAGVHGDRLLRAARRAFVLSVRRSHAQQAAVDVSVWPVMKAASSLVQERDGADEVGRHLAARDRLPRRRDCERFLHVGLARTRPARHGAGRARERRRDRVDGDAVRAKLGRKHTREADQAALAGDVVREAGRAGEERATTPC